MYVCVCVCVFECVCVCVCVCVFVYILVYNYVSAGRIFSILFVYLTICYRNHFGGGYRSGSLSLMRKLIKL